MSHAELTFINPTTYKISATGERMRGTMRKPEKDMQLVRMLKSKDRTKRVKGLEILGSGRYRNDPGILANFAKNSKHADVREHCASLLPVQSGNDGEVKGLMVDVVLRANTGYVRDFMRAHLDESDRRWIEEHAPHKKKAGAHEKR
jgi:hypothetical protein